MGFRAHCWFGTEVGSMRRSGWNAQYCRQLAGSYRPGPEAEEGGKGDWPRRATVAAQIAATEQETAKIQGCSRRFIARGALSVVKRCRRPPLYLTAAAGACSAVLMETTTSGCTWRSNGLPNPSLSSCY